MKRQRHVRSIVGLSLLTAVYAAGSPAIAQSPLSLESSRITIAGTSNVHDWTADTSDVRVTRVQIGSASAGAPFWDEIQKAGGLQVFELTIPSASLKSPKEGLDKNMHKALKVKEHPEITFRLGRFEGTSAALTAVGTLRIAGVEREVALALKTARKGEMLSVTGEASVLMTDFGIEPPKAMLGMIKADPKVKITFEVVLALTTT